MGAYRGRRNNGNDPKASVIGKEWECIFCKDRKTGAPLTNNLSRTCCRGCQKSRAACQATNSRPADPARRVVSTEFAELQKLQKVHNQLAKRHAKLQAECAQAAEAKDADEPMESGAKPPASEDIKALELKKNAVRKKLRECDSDDEREKELFEVRITEIDEKLAAARAKRNDAKPDSERLRAAEQEIRRAEAQLARGEEKATKKYDLVTLALQNFKTANEEVDRMRTDVEAAKKRREEIANQINAKPAPPAPPPQVSEARSSADMLRNIKDFFDLYGDAMAQAAAEQGHQPEAFKQHLGIIAGFEGITRAKADSEDAAKAASAQAQSTEDASLAANVDVDPSPVGGTDPHTAPPPAAAQGSGTGDIDAVMVELEAEPDAGKKRAILKRLAERGEGAGKPPKAQRPQA